MTEEELFLAALELANPAERTAYLETTCGRDVALRQQVEKLLVAHFKEGPFLEEPAAEVFAGNSSAVHKTPGPASPDPAENAVSDHAQVAPQTPADLHFLQPSTRPDSLGRIGHYELLELLGRGSFGIVFRAFDDALQRVVAIKLLAPAIAATSPARKRFLREARSSAQVRHENVVHVYAVEEQPSPYLVMEFIPGETLQQRLDRTGPLEASEIIRLGRQIAEGLAAAHAAGVIHRDIKPGNVLIEGANERVKITDFGLARAADDASQTQTGVLAGTPMYMAPEQARGEALDDRTDLFSLGSVMYLLATGRPPFRASTTFGVLKRVVEDSPRPIREIIPELPEWLGDVIARLHEKNPGNRFQSARELADVLADFETQLKTNSSVSDFSRLVRRRPGGGTGTRRNLVAAAVLLLPLLILAITETAGISHWFRKQDPLPGHQTETSLDSARPGAPADEQQAITQLPTDYANTLGMEFKFIPAGRFRMGSSPAEVERLLEQAAEINWVHSRLRAEAPDHDVEITRPFYLGVKEVTVREYRRFLEANPNYLVNSDRWKAPDFYQSEQHPMTWISWQNAVDFCKWLSALEGREYRLPTEAEWEWSCRAGTETRFCFGDDDSALGEYAWFAGNSERRIKPVGLKAPNDWGLYDMHGNAWEYCLDHHDSHYYEHSALQDPPGGTGTACVSRGGAWDSPSLLCRSAFRHHNNPGAHGDGLAGFRVLLVAPQQKSEQ